MKDVIKYKNFMATIHFNADDEVFHGKIAGINDLITLEGQSVQELKKAMKDAVEDYLEICRKLDKDPHKSFKGSFNVRINPKLHQYAAQKSTKEGVSLNQLIEKAISSYLMNT